MTQEQWEKRYFDARKSGWKYVSEQWGDICGCCVHSGNCPCDCITNFKLASYDTVLSRLNDLDYSSSRWKNEIAEMKRLALGEEE